MTVYVYFTNADSSERINLNAERIDQQINRNPLIYDRAMKSEPKMRDLRKMRNVFLITGFIGRNYDIDNDAADETAIEQKHWIEDAMKNWPADGNGSHHFTWADRTYTGLITKVNFTETGGLENQYEVILEFIEGTF